MADQSETAANALDFVTLSRQIKVRLLERQTLVPGRQAALRCSTPFPLSVAHGESDSDTRRQLEEDAALRCSIPFPCLWLVSQTWTPGDSYRKTLPCDALALSLVCGWRVRLGHQETAAVLGPQIQCFIHDPVSAVLRDLEKRRVLCDH